MSGWLTVKAPFAVEVRENGRLVGTTDADRIMMAAGKHELELVNETLGYRVARTVQVPPGKVAPLSVELPQGVDQRQRVAVGRSLDRRPPRRRDADRQPAAGRSDRTR